MSVLAGVAQWIECQPANQEAAGSVPSQGTCLGCRPVPNLEASKRQPTRYISHTLMFLSLSFSLLSPLSKNK